MAEALKRTYDVLVLKVEADDRASEGGVQASFTLQVKDGGRLVDVVGFPARFPVPGLAEIMAPRGRSRGEDHSRLPEALLSVLRRKLRFLDALGKRPLWVHLVKPYGALRFVQWERELGQALHRPVLMLPDFIFPRPREALAWLDVALCASVPLGANVYSVWQALQETARAILLGSPRPTRLQVFADDILQPVLRVNWAADLARGLITLHDPQDASDFFEDDPSSRTLDSAGVLRSPWLLWMRRALRERSVDVVHFCCHGHLSRGHGAMLFAQSPLSRTGTYLAGPVGAVELQTFLTQVGAWSTAFASLADNHSAAGLRGLADEVAQMRPGPMLMHDMDLDPLGEALTEAYRFIYAAGPGVPPASQALFLYCQPYLSRDAMPAEPAIAPYAPSRARDVAISWEPSGGQELQLDSSQTAPSHVLRNELQGLQVMAAARESQIDVLFAGNDTAQPWVATTERFAEDLQLRLQQLARDELVPESLARHQSEIAADTLESLRAAVTMLAQRRGSP